MSGLSILAVGDTPRVMTEGNWRLGVILDAAASDEQAEKLGALFGGQLGGPMAALAPLVGENIGMERLPIEFSSENGRHSVRAGDAVDVEVEDVVPFGSESGEPARVAGVFHPASSELNVSKASRSKVTVFGLDLAQEGKSGFSTAFLGGIAAPSGGRDDRVDLHVRPAGQRPRPDRDAGPRLLREDVVHPGEVGMSET